MPFISIDGDLELDSTAEGFVMVSGPELARDRLRVLLGMGEGSYRYDLNAGLPITKILALRGDDVALVQTIFTRWLLGLDFISAVESVRASYNKAERIYSIAFVAITPFGRVEDTYNFGLVT